MNTHAVTPRRRLHLVTADSEPDPTEEKMTQKLAEGVLKYQALQDEFNAEVLSKHPDLDHVAELIVEMDTVRKALLAYGVRVRL
jgi:hypothetical protein